MKDNIRFRRLDEHNFVIERWQVPKGERKDDAWAILGYYSSVDAMLRDAVNTGARGQSAKELAEAVQTSTRTLLDAFQKAVETGALVIDREAKAERYRKAVKTRQLGATK